MYAGTESYINDDGDPDKKRFMFNRRTRPNRNRGQESPEFTNQ